MKNKQSNEIKNLRSKVKKTLRVTSSSLESILYKPFKVLDSGFIRVIAVSYTHLTLPTNREV